ncbi:MAG TPA: extracellular solute-binding protein [Devosia sp.]|nr:extracellular solute-binding protein [Devosia sp.]
MAERIVLRGMTWGHIRGYDPMVVTSERFAETHPGVEIVWEQRSLQAFADQPIGTMSDSYDLMVIDHPHVGEAAASGDLLALDGQGRDAELAQLAAESAGVSHVSYNFGGKQWALGIDAATPISVYRPDLLDAAPTRWDEVIALAEKGQVLWPVKPINALMSLYNQLANLGKPFGADGVGADPATAIAALEAMRAVTKHLPKQCFSMDPIGAYEWLSVRSSHAYVPYLYGYSNYSRPGFRPFLVQAADIPAHGDAGPVGSPIGGTGIAISSRTKHPELALEYAFWIASAECQRGLFFDAGGQPANGVAWRDPACNAASSSFFSATLATLEQSYLRPRHRGYMAFQDVGGDLVHACLRGATTPADCVAALNNAYARSFSA